MDGVHDLGGMHGFGPVVAGDTEATHDHDWEIRAQGIGIVSGAISRRRIEALDPAQYLAAGYYERWLLAAENAVVAREVVDRPTLDGWYDTVADDRGSVPTTAATPERAEVVGKMLSTPFVFQPVGDATFDVGEQVRVRRMRPERHHRCPRYVRGVVGQIEHVCGRDRLPGIRPGVAPVEPVYTVQFSSRDLWGDHDEPPFTVLVDLWQSYLEPA